MRAIDAEYQSRLALRRAKLAAEQNKGENKGDDRYAKSVGEEAQGEILALGGSSRLSEAHEAVSELGKGNREGARQLENILTQLLGSAKNLTEGQIATFQLIYRHLEKSTRRWPATRRKSGA